VVPTTVPVWRETAGFTEKAHRSRRRQESPAGVFGVDARLDGVTSGGRHGRLVGPRERLAGGHAHLQLDQVESEYQLRHGVLYLQPGVHLHEEVLPGPIRRHYELDGACPDVPARNGRGHRARRHGGPAGVVEERGRCFLDDLLVSALQAALALSQRDDRSVGVGEDLHLDVARPGYEALHQQGAVTERPDRLPLSFGDGVGQVGGDGDQPHALTTPARRRLEQDRKPDVQGGVGQLFGTQAGFVSAGHDRHPGRGDGALGVDLVAHGFDCRRRRSDEHDPRFGASAGQRRVFRQEPVTGVEGLRPDAGSRVDDGLDVQIGAGRSDADGLVGGGDVHGVAVDVGVDGDAADAHRLEGADDPYCYLAAVGD